ncbi:hypothetical protein B7494_g1082 [Chlorociboria aeruginascens]|nr:hypothetical protein B7494_g1082 [Chlorociboria aeruginascens]
MASAEGEFKQCEIVYLPILKKYARYEDECEQCTSDWSKSTKHIDVWIGSSTKSGGDTQEDCENNLTPDGTWSLLKSPPQTLPVSADPLFTPPKNCSTRLVWPIMLRGTPSGTSSEGAVDPPSFSFSALGAGQWWMESPPPPLPPPPPRMRSSDDSSSPLHRQGHLC